MSCKHAQDSLSDGQHGSTAEETLPDLDWCKIDSDGWEESQADEHLDLTRQVSSPGTGTATSKLGRCPNEEGLRPWSVAGKQTNSSHDLVEVLESSRIARTRATLRRERFALCMEIILSQLRGSVTPSLLSSSTSTSPFKEYGPSLADLESLDNQLRQIKSDDAACERLDAQLKSLTGQLPGSLLDAGLCASQNVVPRQPESAADSDISRGVPEVIMDLLERLGDLSILEERRIELDQTEAARLRDPTTHDIALNDTLRLIYLERLHGLESRHATILPEIESLKMTCIEQGFDPSHPSWYHLDSFPAAVDGEHSYVAASRTFVISPTTEHRIERNLPGRDENACGSTCSWDSAVDVRSEDSSRLGIGVQK